MVATSTPAAFFVACARRTALEATERAAAATLAAIPGVGSGAMGLTPDAVKFADPYRTAKAAHDAAFAAMRAHNGVMVKAFPRQLRAERDARRQRLTIV